MAPQESVSLPAVQSRPSFGQAAQVRPREAVKNNQAYQPVFPLVFLMGDSDCTWDPVALAQAANDGNPYAQAALNRARSLTRGERDGGRDV